MTVQNSIPDAMPDIRYWLRNHPYLANLSAGRVFFKMPTNVSTAPAIRIYRTGGAIQNDSEVPLMDIDVAMEVWGFANADYALIRQTEQAVQAALQQLALGTLLNPSPTSGGARGHNAKVTASNDSPDPDMGYPRIVMQTIWTVSL